MIVYSPDTMPWAPETEVLVAQVLAVGKWDESTTFEQLTFLVGARTILSALADAGLLVKPQPAEVTEVINDTVKEWRSRGGFRS